MKIETITEKGSGGKLRAAKDINFHNRRNYCLNIKANPITLQ
jgi:hypothetical protein